MTSSSVLGGVVQVDGAIEDLGREVAQRGELVGGEPGGAEGLVGDRREGGGSELTRDGGTDPAVDGSRRAARELLERDRADERPEVSVLVTRSGS